jgi:hypothetical protein
VLNVSEPSDFLLRDPVLINIPEVHFMYKRNTMAVRITIIIVENQEVYVFRVCVCGTIYPAYKAHAPYYFVICGLSGSSIFFHIIS